MFYQIEITTHCNFQCFYCAGRDMPQRHMDWSLFERILANVPAGDHEISLQGEGEPTMHPRFWDMVEAVRARGFVPYTITNSSHVDAERFAAAFPRVGVSLDTLDPAEAERIGRFKLDRVLANLDALAARMGPQRIHVKTVDYGQPVTPVADFARGRGYGHHAMQRLQCKDDYARRYPERLEAKPRRYTHRCKYLEQPLRRYYDIEGREYPCCYIKDATLYEPIERLRAKMQSGDVPAACTGCREILAPESQPVPLPVTATVPERRVPAVSFVVTCKGRLGHLQVTLPRLAGQPDAETVVVDYDCPDRAADWVAANFPKVKVVHTADQPVFNAARARNLGARAASGRWLCFADADIVFDVRFVERVTVLLQPGGFYGMGAAGAQAFGTVLCERTDWLAVGGYDEVMEGWGAEDRDFYVRLAALGRTYRPLPADFAAVIDHGDAERTRFHDTKDRWLSQRANALYVQIKHDLARQFGQPELARDVRASLYHEVQRTVRKADGTAQPRCRFEVTLPPDLVAQLFGGWRMQRMLTYTLEPAIQPERQR